MYKQIYINRIYDSHPDFCAEGNTNAVVFDIGANIGIYTVRTAKTYANCVVYSFEPNPDVFTRLKKNISLNNLNNVKLFPLGFADRKTTAYLDAEQSTVLGRISHEKGQTEVKLETLDLFISEEPVNRIDILKIDVEGFELSVLKGAEHTLERVRKIVMECDKSLEEEVCAFLEDKGFRLIMKIPRYNILYFHHKNRT
jgi:FkbM family methyltransferase